MRPHKQIGPTVPQVVGGPVPSKQENGGRRKGKALKRNPRQVTKARVTVAQARAALKIDPNATYDEKTKCLIYKREA